MQNVFDLWVDFASLDKKWSAIYSTNNLIVEESDTQESPNSAMDEIYDENRELFG